MIDLVQILPGMKIARGASDVRVIDLPTSKFLDKSLAIANQLALRHAGFQKRRSFFYINSWNQLNAAVRHPLPSRLDKGHAEDEAGWDVARASSTSGCVGDVNKRRSR